MCKLQLNSIIRDIEDGDCYYEGIVVSTNPLQYKITNIVWDNELDTSMNGTIVGHTWWLLQVYNLDTNEWFDVV